MSDQSIYYSKELVELLHKQFENMSLELWHKIMNPMCGTCLAERGRYIIENGFKREVLE